MTRQGVRPRDAAYIISAIWALAVVVFGVVEHLVDPDSFDTVWLGMWWALETVTTVGYGDVVPADTAGKVIASFLLLGGLSLFAVITGTITTAFVTQAQTAQQLTGEDPVMQELERMSEELAAIRSDLARLQGDDG